ncbi:DNA-3-methyladenine glycosylase [Paenibacillus psychroresistens]|uniref:Putative 3-methyladenine DNA glycosylase n=1 Tax=Paenibacillus psychroresistens TaxID=1778678 RepID=A0A6B8RLV5_9BACL|nr:DNA-3-methyladenine glycosylase [Paenibacillus psychroresistens]QGQ96318.1 DNA-3-methyladenine glycosylase [Paenibacillus psychroresistens]
MLKAFLEQDPVKVAEQILGYHLVRQTPLGRIRLRITETEAYKGSEDPASHSYRGLTPRNQLMFGDVGVVYVYFIYGMHFCMNIVSHREGEVGAILLRAAEVMEGYDIIRANRPKAAERDLINGPAKLTQALNINMGFNGYDLLQPTDELVLEKNNHNRSIIKTSRIGISKGQEFMWRFVLGKEQPNK